MKTYTILTDKKGEIRFVADMKKFGMTMLFFLSTDGDVMVRNLLYSFLFVYMQ